ncbi:MAG: hypothetical protein ACT6FG_05700 [Methanosarcinaceae archaeon]
MSPSQGYKGGNVRKVVSFITGLVGSDDTGASVVSKRNNVIGIGFKNRKGKRVESGRWG